MSDQSIYRVLPQEMAREWNNFLPGIDTIIFIAGDGKYSDWNAAEWIRKGNSYNKRELVLSEEMSDKLIKIRKFKSDFQWITKQQIPFYIKNVEQNIGQLSIFNEEKYLILVIRVKTEGQVLPDIFYLFFRNDKSNFGINHDSTPIDTSQKSIIGMMAANFAKVTYDNLFKSLYNTEYIKKKVADLLKFSRNNLNNSQNIALSEWKKDWAEDVLKGLGERDDVNYVYNKDAVKLLTENSYSYNTIKQAIEEAAKLARLLSPIDRTENITVEGFHIKFTDVTHSVNGELSHSDEKALITRMDKAYLLLDKLENAAQKLLKESIQPSSERVGKAMEQPITAPAIRDALKKHQSRVLQLLKRYPDRWLYIRSQFRPVTNLFPKNRLSARDVV